jgi:hypothetical protein
MKPKTHCGAIRGKPIHGPIDLILKAKDEKGEVRRIECHQLIMFVFSPTMQMFLKYRPQEDSIPEVLDFTKEITYEVLQIIVDYCYKGNLKLTEFNHEKIKEAAEYLGIVRIINDCNSYCSQLRNKEITSHSETESTE